MIRRLVVGVSLVVAALPVPAHASYGWTAFEIARARPGGPRQITVSVEATETNSDGTAALAISQTHVVDGHREAWSTFIGQLQSGTAIRIFGVPQLPDCVALCDATSVGGMGVAMTTQVDATTKFVVGSDVAKLRVKVSSPYWKIRATTARIGAVRGDANGVGVAVGPVGIETFTGASLRGGRYGSTAFAALPCGDAGVGTARLSAEGYPGEDLLCPLRPIAFGDTRYNTQWDLAGYAAGHPWGYLRLLVIDFPKG